MNAHANDRATADTHPAAESWMYRSEAFAEDLDDATPVLTVAAPAAAGASKRHHVARRAPWSAALAGLWQARAQAAR